MAESMGSIIVKVERMIIIALFVESLTIILMYGLVYMSKPKA